MDNCIQATGSHRPGMGAAEVPRVRIGSPTLDWVKAEVARYLAVHPGEERRAMQWVKSRPEYRQMARAFYGEEGGAR